MATVKFVSVDSEKREVTMDVDGKEVVRGIANNVEDTDAYIQALANGLAIEADNESAKVAALKETTYKSGDVLV